MFIQEIFYGLDHAKLPSKKSSDQIAVMGMHSDQIPVMSMQR